MSTIIELCVPRRRASVPLASVRQELALAIGNALDNEFATVPSYCITAQGSVIEQHIGANQALVEAMEGHAALRALRNLLNGAEGRTDADLIKDLRTSLQQSYADLNALHIAEARGARA
jgi:hypothetical protein